jgi:hypothetical protein
MTEEARYYGKYRGKVANNIDPVNQGRIQVTCPDILGEGRQSWAMPCTPYAGKNVGLFAVPPEKANVWVEFEAGDPNHPIYSGCFWDSGHVPATPALPTTKMLKTDGLTLKIDDRPGAGGVTIEVGPPVVPAALKISLTSSGIVFSNGAASVKLTPTTVSLNEGALQVI